MIMGYGIIAVPTGIVTLELNEANRRQANTRTCPGEARQKATLARGELFAGDAVRRCIAELQPRVLVRRVDAATTKS